MAKKLHQLNFFSFRALVRFTYGPDQGCGGIVDLRTQNTRTINSLDTNNDNSYEIDLNCQWLVIARNNKNVRMTFSSFDVERAENETDITCWDYVEVRENFRALKNRFFAKLSVQF